MKLIIVESPAKIFTISKYLDSSYMLAASYGHIAELEQKGKGVDIENDFKINIKYNPHKNTKDMLDKAKKSDEIYLASDFDREGEKIAYDIKNYLEKKKCLKKGVKIYRITFNEITKKSILEAIQNKHDINTNLIASQEARSAIDYLFGFNLSPVLWVKMPGAKSAGRVQSVALRMVCEKEKEIRGFVSQEYWSSIGLYNGIEARLDRYGGEKVGKFFFTNEKSVKEAKDILMQQDYHVSGKQNRKTEKKPQAPFITSSLQREAYLRYGFAVKKTMRIAQRLYEGSSDFDSLITYMRTDSVNLSEFGLDNIRTFIAKNYDNKYLSEDKILYGKKVKNAQEAHEAIRPIDVNVTPDSVNLDHDERKLYELIWKRALACQMTNQIKENISFSIGSSDGQYGFTSSYSKILFDGFTKVYDYLVSKDDKSFDIHGSIKFDDIVTKQHFTEPPARYNEASLIENLEKYGIGRPSTYANIISTIIDRSYVVIDNKRLVPHVLGESVTLFLKYFFDKYVDFYFTGNIEEGLDKIANGSLEKLSFLNDFWNPFSDNIEKVKKFEMYEILKKMQADLYDIFKLSDKKCQKCSKPMMVIMGKHGPYLSCEGYPDCKYIENIVLDQSLGFDENGNEVLLKKGRYGYYVESNDKRADVNATKDRTTLEDALRALQFPRILGTYNENEIKVALGRFGYYAKVNDLFVSIPRNRELDITLDETIELYHKKQQKLLNKKPKADTK